MHSLLKNKPEADDVVTNIIKEAVSIDQEFVVESMHVELIDISSDQMCLYVQSFTDHLLFELGCEAYYKVENPLKWMTMISLQVKTNFFQESVGEYSKAHIGLSTEDYIFTMTAEF